MKTKFYAVAAGRRCGIFTDWPSAEAEVKGFAGARYKSFASRQDAEAWLDNPVYQKKAPAKDNHRPVTAQEGQRPGAIVVFTDGGCINNPGPGGYGVVILANGQRQELSSGYRLTTNNRMESMAAIVALEHLQGCGTAIDLYSDSSYLVNGVVKGWAKKWQGNGWRKADGGTVLNVDLWQRLLALIDKLDVRFHWVKGHDGNEGNEQCDRLAVAAANQAGLPVDPGYPAAGGLGKGEEP